MQMLADDVDLSDAEEAEILADDVDLSDAEEAEKSREGSDFGPGPIEKILELIMGGLRKLTSEAGAGEGWESPVINDEVSEMAGRRPSQEMRDSSGESRSDSSRPNASNESWSGPQSDASEETLAMAKVVKNYTEHRRQNRNRRTVSFYKTTFGFQEPFQVIVDVTFVHFGLKHQLSFEAALANLLGGRSDIFVTRCVKAELERLAEGSKGLQREAFAKSAHAAQQLQEIRCNHGIVLRATECLAAFLEVHRHYFLGTVDVELRKLLRKNSRVPVIYPNGISLALEPPSKISRRYAKMQEQSSMKRTRQAELHAEKQAKEEEIQQALEEEIKPRTKSQKKNAKKRARRKRKSANATDH